MTRLDELSQRYHTHPDEGGDYLSLDELNELCSLQNDEIKRLTAMVSGESPLPDKDHIIASRMEINHQQQEIERLNSREPERCCDVCERAWLFIDDEHECPWCELSRLRGLLGSCGHLLSAAVEKLDPDDMLTTNARNWINRTPELQQKGEGDV